MERSVEFYCRGERIAALLHLPEGAGPGAALPAIVLCHGYFAIKEQWIPEYARRFVDAGFAALTFDYRGFGESEGARGWLSPYEQVRDIRAAMSFMELREEVDPNRIGLWGTSFGCGHVVVAASLDGRAKAVVAQGGFGDADRLLRRRGHEAYSQVTAMIEEDRTRRVLEGRSKCIPFAAMLNDEETLNATLEVMKRYPRMNVELPIEALAEIREYKPECRAPYVTAPILVIGAENDALVPVDESVAIYERAEEPKRLEILPISHIGLYRGEGMEAASGLAVDWFGQHL